MCYCCVPLNRIRELPLCLPYPNPVVLPRFERVGRAPLSLSHLLCIWAFLLSL